jgi:hypothetical protein
VVRIHSGVPLTHTEPMERSGQRNSRHQRGSPPLRDRVLEPERPARAGGRLWTGYTFVTNTLHPAEISARKA